MASSDFLALPLRLQCLIDEAFDLTADPGHTVDGKAKDTIPQQNVTIGAGGFLIESPPNTSGTTVTIDDNTLERQNNTSISLSSIPSALQLLDLPPDDAEVLSVFKNAASGWTSDSITSFEGLNSQEKFVSREDWRSVCAILLEYRKSGTASDDEPLSRMSNSENWQEDAELGSEGYIDHESGGDSAESSSDEYMEHPIRPQKRVRDQKRQITSRLTLNPTRPSSRQKETCLKTFALFFPEATHHNLADHRIMIKDLQRVSKLLGEKIKAEEMVEMLSTFSTSPDKSVSFDDFCRIMVTAQLA